MDEIIIQHDRDIQNLKRQIQELYEVIAQLNAAQPKEEQLARNQTI